MRRRASSSGVTLRSQKGPAQYFTPIASAEYVYGGALGVGGGLVRLKPDGNGVAAEQVYYTRGLPNGIGGAVVIGDHIYGTEVGQKLVAAEFKTGKIKWEAPNFGWGSVAAADGLLFFTWSLAKWSWLKQLRTRFG